MYTLEVPDELKTKDVSESEGTFSMETLAVSDKSASATKDQIGSSPSGTIKDEDRDSGTEEQSRDDMDLSDASTHADQSTSTTPIVAP